MRWTELVLVWARESFGGLEGGVVVVQQQHAEGEMESSSSTTALQQQVPFGPQLVCSASSICAASFSVLPSSWVSDDNRGVVSEDVAEEEPSISDVNSRSQVT